MQDKQKSLVDKIWDIFASVTTAVVLFTAISLTSIVGTVVQQQAEPQKNIDIIAKFVGKDLAPSVYVALDKMGFTDMYHSWWFMALLFLFASNLVICSIDRLPKIIKLINEPMKPIAPEHFTAFAIKEELSIKGNADKLAEVISSKLSKIGFKPEIHSDDHSVQLLAQSGRYSRLGVYVTHLSILIILIGAIVGILFGFNGFLNLMEGESSAYAYHFGTAKEIPLGFEIRCEDFDVLFYEGTDTPKAYKSWLTILENGKPVSINGKTTHEIEVNTPLRYKGVTFYQSSYGFQPTINSLFKFNYTATDGKKHEFAVKFEESFVLPDSGISVKVIDFSPAISMDQAGRLFTYADMMNNPAVFLEFTKGSAVQGRQWILSRYPETWKTPLGTIEFKDLWGCQYTGLQVRKDPGVWIVYLGCILMSVGLYMAFFMSHRRLWVYLSKNSSKHLILASSNKGKISLQNKIQKLAAEINMTK